MIGCERDLIESEKVLIIFAEIFLHLSSLCFCSRSCSLREEITLSAALAATAYLLTCRVDTIGAREIVQR